MHHRHQRLRHLARLRVLDDVPSVYDSAGALPQNLQRALENHLFLHAAAAARQHGTPAGRFHQAMKLPRVRRRIALDQVGAEFRRLPHQRRDAAAMPGAFVVPVRPRFQHQRFDHQRHGVALALRLSPRRYSPGTAGIARFCPARETGSARRPPHPRAAPAPPGSPAAGRTTAPANTTRTRWRHRRAAPAPASLFRRCRSASEPVPRPTESRPDPPAPRSRPPPAGSRFPPETPHCGRPHDRSPGRNTDGPPQTAVQASIGKHNLHHFRKFSQSRR